MNKNEAIIAIVSAMFETTSLRCKDSQPITVQVQIHAAIIDGLYTKLNYNESKPYLLEILLAAIKSKSLIFGSTRNDSVDKMTSTIADYYNGLGSTIKSFE